MTLRHFKIYTKVCEKMNMTAAANELFISQPAVSQAIAELESHYHTKLFERYSNKLHITESGRRLMTYAYHMIAYFDQIELSMASGSNRPTVNVGATMTVGPYFLPPVVAKYNRQADSPADISIHTYNTLEVERYLLTADLDIAIVEGTIQSKDIAVTPLVEDEMVFVCREDSRLLNVEPEETIPLDPEQLRRIPFLMRETGSGSRKQVESMLRKNGVDYQISGVFNNLEGIKRAAYHDLGIGVVSRRAISPKEGLKCFSIEGIRFSRVFSLAHHKNKYISPEIRGFIDFVEQHLHEGV